MLQSLISQVNEMMEGYYLYAVVPPMVEFIDHLTNWYIRRSRRRFWRSREASDTDKLSAFATLYDVLVTFSKVIAPVLPFVTEEIYQELVVTHRSSGEDGPASVHLSDYPAARTDLIDLDLEREMATVRQVVTLGRSLRVTSGIRVRQPLESITVYSRDKRVLDAVETHTAIIAEELNVRQVSTGLDELDAVDIHAKANFKVLGPRLGPSVREVAAAIAALDGAAIGALLEGRTVELAGHDIAASDITVQRTPKSGRVVAADGNVSVALDVELTDELIAEGLAREFINRIQQVRRDLDLDVTDRISVRWATDDAATAAALEFHGALISAEVLAIGLTRVEELDSAQLLDVDGSAVFALVERA
jgi:isoleucyl-tRNA synthetase